LTATFLYETQCILFGAVTCFILLILQHISYGQLSSCNSINSSW